MPGTLARLFRHTVSYNKPDTILTKSDGAYRPISSQELHRRVGRLHLELARAGIQKGGRCALLSENRWEWAVADFAMMTAGVVSVPLYPTLGAKQIHYLLEHSEARVIMLSTPRATRQDQKHLGPSCPPSKASSCLTRSRVTTNGSPRSRGLSERRL